MDKQERKKLADAYKARRAVGGVFAVRNSANGKSLVQYTADLRGSKNRFEFSQATGGCAFMPLQGDYKRYGAGVFKLEVMEELEQKEGQAYTDFKNEIEELYAIVLQDMDPDKLY